MEQATRVFAAVSVIVLAVTGCKTEKQSVVGPKQPEAILPNDNRTFLTDQAKLAVINRKPLYQCSEGEIDLYLRHLHATEPNLQKRIVTIARKNIEQPYELYLLGEAPFESTDNQPIYCLTKSDCVVFAEHTIAMALSDGFPEFLRMLQRIRYNNGEIGVVTRNHFTEADWNVNNRWLVTDITNQLGGDKVIKFKEKVDRAKFFKSRYKLDETMPVETIEESFIPYEAINSVKPLLREGDIVNFVSGTKGGYWVGHVGLVAHGADGSVHLIHSSEPKVREETIDSYIQRMSRTRAEKEATGKAVFRGFKFLRLAADPIANLRMVDGAQAPKVSTPPSSPLTFDQYVRTIKLGG
jgi:hypothetical protein